MKKKWFAVKDIFIAYIICSAIIFCVNVVNKGGVEILSFYSAIPLKKSIGKKQEKMILRKFVWLDPAKKSIETIFNIPNTALKKEIAKFGTPFHSKSLFLIKRRGFKVIDKREYFLKGRFFEKVTLIVDYQLIFQRNLLYFSQLTKTLMNSADLKTGDDPLNKFLYFVQYIKYKKPPRYYRGKFINNFFIPLVCLYEQYGDCDSKSLLLAEFLGSVPYLKIKMAMILIRINGTPHAMLAVKRNPLPGMTSLYFFKKGYFITIETSKPGWSPGFTSKRIFDALKSGRFLFLELN